MKAVCELGGLGRGVRCWGKLTECLHKICFLFSLGVGSAFPHPFPAPATAVYTHSRCTAHLFCGCALVVVVFVVWLSLNVCVRENSRHPTEKSHHSSTTTLDPAHTLPHFHSSVPMPFAFAVRAPAPRRPVLCSHEAPSCVCLGLGALGYCPCGSLCFVGNPVPVLTCLADGSLCAQKALTKRSLAKWLKAVLKYDKATLQTDAFRAFIEDGGLAVGLELLAVAHKVCRVHSVSTR
jgi:hypothetical protein